MRRIVLALAVILVVSTSGASAGDAEIQAAQSAIEGQIRAFLADDETAAYGFAAPNIKRLFPSVDRFMSMVKGGYKPVWKPRNFAFGKTQEVNPTSIIQQVLLVGPDGKDYEAIYTLELQSDGTFRITGVSLRGATSLGA
jgi:hypothetical protein